MRKPELIPPTVHEDGSALWDLAVFFLMVHNVLYRHHVVSVLLWLKDRNGEVSFYL